MLEKNPENVKIVFKHFILKSHKQAKPAALASIAAQKQGKFWDYHDQLFQNMQVLSPQKYLEIATNLGLDMEKFMKDMADPEAAKRVTLETRQGAAAGVRGTPTIYVNGRRLKDRSVNGFQKLIDKELAKKEK